MMTFYVSDTQIIKLPSTTFLLMERRNDGCNNSTWPLGATKESPTVSEWVLLTQEKSAGPYSTL